MTVPRSQSPPTGSCRAPQSRRTQAHLRAWRCTGLSESPKGLPRKSCGRLSACWWLQESLRDQDDFISQLSPAIDLVSNRRAVRQDRWPRPLSTFLELSSRGVSCLWECNRRRSHSKDPTAAQAGTAWLQVRTGVPEVCAGTPWARHAIPQHATRSRISASSSARVAGAPRGSP